MWRSCTWRCHSDDGLMAGSAACVRDRTGSACSRRRLLRQGAPKRMAADLQLFGHLHFGVLARAQQGAGLFQVVSGQGFRSAPDTAALARGFEPGGDALVQKITLEFRQRGKQMECQFAAGRRGVDVLGEGLQFDATLMEQGHGVDKLTERTRQAVQLPNYNDVTLPRVIEQPYQLRPVGCGPGRLLLIDATALGACERIQLQVGFLGIGGDARSRSSWCKNPTKVLVLYHAFCTRVLQLFF